MRLPRFEYLEPKTLKEASRMLLDKGSVLLAGGTDLLVNMKQRVIVPGRLINLKKIPRLDYIAEGKEGLSIGALTTLHEIASSFVIKQRWSALARAASEVGAYAHQSMGTLGGNLCQENRCRFFNQSAFWRSVRSPCYKTGGEICHVLRKPRQCHSTYCGDMAPVLIALDARAKVSGPKGERDLPLKKIYTQNGKKPLALRKGEILREIYVPHNSGKTIYLKWRLRESLEFPIVSLALHLEKDEKKQIKKVKIVFSGVGSGPVEAILAQKILKTGPFDEQMIEKVIVQALKEISPMRTSLYSPAYKRRMAEILLRQALKKVMELH